MKAKNGITLITLVVTIITLLILIGVTLSFTLGSDGLIEKSKSSELETRYVSILDKVKIREFDMELSAARGEIIELPEEFINRLELEGFINLDKDEDEWNNDTRTLSLGKQQNGLYKYSIYIADEEDIEDVILGKESLPNTNLPGNEDMKNLTLIVKPTVSNLSVLLPISNMTNLSVNWDATNGSSTFVTFGPTELPGHTYSEAREYEVQIKGTAIPETKVAADFQSYFSGGGIIPEFAIRNIIGIKYWGENGFYGFNGFGLDLKGNIPIPSQESFAKVTSFNNLFSASQISGDIPANLFAYSPEAIDFTGVFSLCNKLTGSIPKNLFANCNKATVFSGTFWGCTSLIGNAPKLWTRTNVLHSANCFASCNQLLNYNDIPDTWK